MSKDISNNFFMIKEFVNLYNTLVNLSRNKSLFSIFTDKDTFSDRILILLFHFAFFLREYKKNTDKKYLQKFFDYFFRQIELSLREIGYGDVSINKKMKDYINIFYSILDKINDWDNLDNEKKSEILGFYYKLKDNHLEIVSYFDNFEIYLSKTTLKSFTKSVINHKF
tara:strand:+ start:635 stop:1138 length:504 start_codon:yes stop_codon:yes gene_type:complete